MKQTDDFGRLKHMLDHALEARDMVIGKERSDLDSDRKLNLALVRLLEIVGEAAARVSEEGRMSLPQIPWACKGFCVSLAVVSCGLVAADGLRTGWRSG
jgi:uncharacterized protein with HEPN domain